MTIEAMKQWLEALEKSQSALAEELSAWDIDPPLHHVQESHDLCGSAITSLRQAIAEAEKQGGGSMIKWDRPCYKCLSHYCDLSCKESAQPKQEPVAWLSENQMKAMIDLEKQAWIKEGHGKFVETYTIPLYTHSQPKREPLTEDERFQLRCQWNPEIHGALHDYLIQQTEAAHGVK